MMRAAVLVPILALSVGCKAEPEATTTAKSKDTSPEAVCAHMKSQGLFPANVTDEGLAKCSGGLGELKTKVGEASYENAAICMLNAETRGAIDECMPKQMPDEKTADEKTADAEPSGATIAATAWWCTGGQGKSRCMRGEPECNSMRARLVEDNADWDDCKRHARAYCVNSRSGTEYCTATKSQCERTRSAFRVAEPCREL